ncbi:MAG: SRPBCC domain-containing protein [Flavobacteriales bacterium]|nr:SRPBCC domain-containing protein [Flavobacteriales bacterium]MCB9448635.1 SRPBCC domain-containing protein [Flavobacteriales bacterium]
MKHLQTQINIQAPADKVWKVLTDFASYPSWNPLIISISGEKRTGAQLEVNISPPEAKPMKFNPRILVFNEGHELRWKGQLAIPGLFDGEHYFLLEGNGDGTAVTHGEKFSGLLVGLFGGMLKKTEQGFNDMNAALKKVCEEAVS